MKIIYCIAGTYRSGGMERVLAYKASYLSEHGNEVVIVTTDQRGRPPFFALHPGIRCVDMGVNYEENNGTTLLNKVMHYPYRVIVHRRRLTRLLMQERADICVSMFCNEAAILDKIHDGSRKVLEVHFSRNKRMQYDRRGLWRVADMLLSWNDRRVARQYDMFVVLTREDAALWGFNDRMCVISNPCPYAPRAVSYDAGSRRVVAVGRYTHQKGFDMLVECWRKVIGKAPGWHLDIIGDATDAERTRLQQLIDDNALGGSVTLLKPVADMEAVYRSASFLVMTSRYEGLPMTLIEAQCFGVPAVAFSCQCGPRDIISDGVNGYLVNPGDTYTMARRILQLTANRDMRIMMSRHALDASRRYGREVIMRQWEQLFRNI